MSLIFFVAVRLSCFTCSESDRVMIISYIVLLTNMVFLLAYLYIAPLTLFHSCYCFDKVREIVIP